MKIQCTWGDGPDILLSLSKTRLVLHEAPIMKHFTHGYISEGSSDLSLEEAKELSFQLSMAIARVEELNTICQDHDYIIQKEENESRPKK